MRSSYRAAVTAVALLYVAANAASDTPEYEAFAYQGQLRLAGEPVTGPINFVFRLFDAEDGGTQIGPALTAPSFDGFDDEGRFTIDLAFGKDIFDGNALWLEIDVDGTTLSPRQPILPTPYAIRALNVAAVSDDALTGAYTNALTMSNAGNQFTGTFSGDGSSLGNLHAGNITAGTLGSSLLSGNYSNALSLTHAANTFAGTFNGSHFGSGAGLTDLNASNISSGTLSALRLPAGGPWSLSSNLSINSNLLHINPTSSRVGIGLSSPQGRLHIRSDVAGESVLMAESTATSGLSIGTFYATASTTTAGSSVIRGTAAGTSGSTFAIIGQNNSTSGTAVRAIANAGSGETYGLWSSVASPNGYAGYFIGGRNYFSGRVGIGTSSPTAPLHVRSTSDSIAIRGAHIQSTTTQFGVVGEINSTSATSTGVLGVSFSTTASNTYGVHGINHSNDSTAIGVLGEAKTGTGVAGVATTAAGGTGVLGSSSGSNGSGVWGFASHTTGTTVAVGGQTMSPNGYAAYFLGPRSYFDGLVGIGTNNPDARLHLHDPGSEVSMKMRAAGSWIAEIQQTNSSYFNFINGGQVRMTIRAGGQVGIGTEEPGSFRLAVNGTAANSTGSWSVFSDARLKRVIEPLAPGTLDQLLALRGYTFEYDSHSVENRLALPGKQVGLIAQEVQSVFPDWVDADDEGYLYITERGTTALLVEALRELRTEKDMQIANQQHELNSLRDEVAELRSLIAGLLATQEEPVR